MPLTLDHDLDAMRVVLLVWLFCAGACVGSFLNVAIFRIPRACMTVLRPRRSFCPQCGRQLTWHDNVPILGWVWLRGRCAGCRLPISLRYPLVELFTALLFLWLGWRHLSPERVLDPSTWGLIGIHAAAGAALIVCTGIDLDHRFIPDEVDLPGAALAPLLVFLVPAALGSPPAEVGPLAGAARAALDSPLTWWGLGGALGPLAWLEELPGRAPELHLRLGALSASLAGGATGAGLLWALGEGFRRLLRRESMGLGDVKYLAMLGALVGPQGLGSLFIVAMFSGSVLGLVHLVRTGRGSLPERLRTGDPYIPFGPFLSLGAAVALYFPEAVPGALRWWLS